MMSSARPQTPPAQHPEGVRTPDAPRHGAFFDNNGPLSPRRSRRTTRNPYSSFSSATARNGATTTPPPQSSPPSPPMSPLATGSRRSPATNKHKQTRDRASKLQAPGGMLLTPAKTPKTTTPPSTGIARRLNFQVADPSDAMPTPRKMKRHTRTGEYEVYGRGAAVEDVEIYSDYNARVPTRDESADNPFYGPPTPASRLGVRQRKAIPKPLTANISNEEMHERVENDEGLIFIFRGKQVFRPYADTLSNIEETESLGYQTIERSMTQPRRLSFATQQNDLDTVDEEAMTDIEEEVKAQETTAPSSSAAIAGAEKTSPFDDWARTKAGSRKREAETEHSNGTSKRVRSDL